MVSPGILLGALSWGGAKVLLLPAKCQPMPKAAGSSPHCTWRAGLDAALLNSYLWLQWFACSILEVSQT
ncbi:hypothetical protein HaLaN_28942 [Haematococcus lacustris]|uniref:Uncharacterized protein n=1 Tax=Haematococcus lacustris TaxID=44745 RepID=A0A6A0ABV9_HAELA|nr:hypothetical protein HaLaN_28942 [Haematococcus lacustris]